MPLCPGIDPRDQVEGRGLPGPVGADDPHDLSLFRAEGEVIHRTDAAEGLGQSAHFEEAHGRTPFIRLSNRRTDFGESSCSPMMPAVR